MEEPGRLRPLLRADAREGRHEGRVEGPLAEDRPKWLGRRKATVNTSISPPAPSTAAITTSRAKP